MLPIRGQSNACQSIKTLLRYRLQCNRARVSEPRKTVNILFCVFESRGGRRRRFVSRGSRAIDRGHERERATGEEKKVFVKSELSHSSGGPSIFSIQLVFRRCRWEQLSLSLSASLRLRVSRGGAHRRESPRNRKWMLTHRTSQKTFERSTTTMKRFESKRTDALSKKRTPGNCPRWKRT